MRWILLTALALGCGGSTAADDSDSDVNATDTVDPAVEGECDDPAQNPFAGTCVETFLAGCFDPSGACVGETDGAGNTTLTWENGASVVTTIEMDGMDVSVLTDLVASDGAVCAEGMTENGVGGCASRTVYVRPDGAQQTWCFGNDGSYAVTCDDGTTIDVSAAQSEAVQECQYGSDAEPCEMQY